MPYVKLEIREFAALLEARDLTTRTGEDHVVLLSPGSAECHSLDSLLEKRFPDLLEMCLEYEKILDRRAAARRNK